MSVLRVIEKKIPILESGFCCCSLYYGTMTVTTLDLIFAVAVFIVASIESSTKTPSNEDIKAALKILAPNRKAFIEGSLAGDVAISVTLILLFLGVIIFCCLAIYGSKTRKPRLLLPWLIGTVGRMFIILILAMTMLATARDSANTLKEIQESVRAHRDIKRHQTSPATKTNSRTTNQDSMMYTSNTYTTVPNLSDADQPADSKRALMNGTEQPEVHTGTEHAPAELIMSFRHAAEHEKALSKKKQEHDKSIDTLLSYKPEAVYVAIVTLAVFLVLSIIVDLYFFLVVHSFYVELQNTSSEPITVDDA